MGILLVEGGYWTRGPVYPETRGIEEEVDGSLEVTQLIGVVFLS